MLRLAALALITACGRGGNEAPGPEPGTHDLATDHGLSGLAVAADGALWAVAERSRGAYRIVLDGDAVGSLERFAIEGIPTGLDLETIAVAGDVFWLGTEGNASTSAQVWTADLAGKTLTARPAPLTVDPATHVIKNNHGVEGVCGDATASVVALETAIEEGGQRFAQVDLRRGDTVAPQRVVLTSTTGKISGIDCAVFADRVEVLAIERHFEVTRLIAFTLRGETEPVPAEVVLDLAAMAKGRNFEGLARLPDGRIALVVDNQWKTIEGPSQLVILPRP